jgi:hypothetical protein
MPSFRARRCSSACNFNIDSNYYDRESRRLGRAMFFRRISGAIASAGLVAGCAFTPSVTASYYFPKAQTQVSITQSLTCNSSGKVISVASVTTSTAYSADYDGGAQGTLRYTDLDGALSDADTSLSFTDDGRLSGVNASSTGQGDTIIKSVLSVASAIGVLGGGAAVSDVIKNGKPKPAVVTSPCQVIKDFGSSKSAQETGDNGKGGAAQPDTAKPGGGDDTTSAVLTLTYTLGFLYEGKDLALNLVRDKTVTPSCPIPKLAPPKPSELLICPDANSLPAYKALLNASPKIAPYGVGIVSEPRYLHQSRYTNADALDDYGDQPPNAVALKLNRVAIVDLVVDGPAGDFTTSGHVWRGVFPVPLRGSYWLPIPKAAVFGKQQFTLALSSYGSINKLEYGKTSGAPDVTDSAGALAKALQAPTPEQQATALQGKSDLIYQTQRLALCQADPKNCSSK